MYKKTVKMEKKYFDSVTLMSLTSKIKKIDGVETIIVAMATEMNLEILNNSGLATSDTMNASPNDLIIAYQLNEPSIEEAVDLAIQDSLFNTSKKANASKEVVYRTIVSAHKEMGGNIAVISVPGDYAAREAMVALKEGMHVMLFSDNVSLNDEITLKKYARDRGLLLMGPDCGTSIINHIGLCFANDVSAGNIGFVAASGTGLQEVTALTDFYGGGISQAIGVGGRDLSEEVGGIMMIEGLKALDKDTITKIIVLVSKPPHPAVEAKIFDTLKNIQKPVIINFLEDEVRASRDGIYFTNVLAQTAQLACELAGTLKSSKAIQHIEIDTHFEFDSKQKYLRGLYCGGTLCSEALMLSRKVTHLKSNVAKKPEEKLSNPLVSEGNTVVDLGDDVFTRGKPHPMIEPAIRLDRIIQEANDPETKVILLDFELGFGSHDDPVGVTEDTIKKAQTIAKENNRDIAFVAYVLGTDKDFQNKEQQVNKLLNCGVVVAQNHAQAVEIALNIVGGSHDVNQ